MNQQQVSSIHPTSKAKKLVLPFFHNLVAAGFPSPATDYLDTKIDLNKYLIQHPNTTFLVKVLGDSMTGAGIMEGDTVIVDRSLEPRTGQTVLAVIDGEFTIKTFLKQGSKIFLQPQNENYESIEITEDMSFQIWGVVTYSITKMT